MKTSTAPQRYALPSIAIHWLMALLILGLLGLGILLEDLPDAPFKFQLIGLHKSFGLLVLVLVMVRLGFRVMFPAPRLPQGTPGWQVGVAHATLAGFYVLMVLVPMSGWVMSDAAGYHPIPFGFDVLPMLAEKSDTLRHTAKEVHEFGANLIWFLLALHIAAAGYHHRIKKDDILRRMLPVWGGKLLPLVALLVLPVIAQAQVPLWNIKPDSSALTWTARLEGNTIEGKFKVWDAKVLFDPKDLIHSEIRVTVDLASVATGNSKNDEALKGLDFFNVVQTPKATFISTSIKPMGNGAEGRYIAMGTLSMAGVSKPFSLPFQVRLNGKFANAESTFTLSRSAFNVGRGEWLGNASLADLVNVHVVLAADHL